jgi:hypothetical protein
MIDSSLEAKLFAEKAGDFLPHIKSRQLSGGLIGKLPHF